MNALLIAGAIGLMLWYQRRRAIAARRAFRASDETLSHALAPREWGAPLDR
jgi:hypothetical protein